MALLVCLVCVCAALTSRQHFHFEMQNLDESEEGEISDDSASEIVSDNLVDLQYNMICFMSFY